MNNIKEEKMTPQVKVSHNILPFGRIRLQITGAERPLVENKPKYPRYVVPLTTDGGSVDIRFFEERETYSVPKTTAG